MSDCPVCARAARMANRHRKARHIARVVAPFLKRLEPGLPGGTMSVAEIEEACRAFPGDGEWKLASDLTAWDTTDANADAGTAPPPPPPPTTPTRKRRRSLRGSKINVFQDFGEQEHDTIYGRDNG
ncbi:hypothetical protein FVEN_g5221 [Fusarium venenatum]|uniref:Uncharacterized protein n=1 Tax=Fusarium venenatum TaxID=56646 RepID=A0A2L2TE66_9HYPO|nr:uncharacterized protein FVRRES_07133 [Fusarium venenatum]KAG8356955.1 hypothetical protein FVEN_g5221 [Fusarium venenatum]CEI62697.1 unnamed protein product [Fusarium venenatum]